MNAILLDAQGHEVEQETITPRRVRLSRAAIDRFAEIAAVESPAAQMVVSTGSLDSLGDRLGSMSPDPAPPTAGPAAGPATAETDVDDVLVAAGLVADGTPTVEGRAVLTVWHAPVLAVELEMLVALRRGKVRVRSWHRNLDDWVVCLSTGDGATFELSWLSADDWWLELGRAAYVDTATLSASTYDDPLPDVVETPWDLLLATGEAVQRRRFELLDQMASDYSGMTLTGVSLDALETADDTDVRRWHEQLESSSRGRLHAAVMGRSERGRPGAGIVEWVLFHDGWRSLTPFTRDGWNMVRIERRSPVDLPRALAVRAAEVTS
ncbi:hypothetical protein SAMN05192575_11489 [Nocardioides alpinus]|uniref:Uncharacterized protein n=1 Tax=Nocardioides alpinus TaxID=748909 RepID=A0A1I1BBC6_9ACTN|nr:hypothetical protein [Nocardioides alpinus]PKH41301.1 hypothetical protein CXG46_09410 [Nocardioides alpinus]SFB46008.1 hypothetical protein SAMN05192575_11489 [Nocardioides alpinus]